MWSSTSVALLVRAHWIPLLAALLFSQGSLSQDNPSQSNLSQGRDWASLLESGRYEDSGRALARLPAKATFEDLGARGVGILRLDLPSARLTFRGLRDGGRGEGDIAAFLTDLILAHRGDPLPLIPRIQGLLEDEDFRTAVLPFLGRGALQLCRSGKKEGAEILEQILALYPEADWAMSNLANGYRFVGQYEKAIRVFDTLMKAHGRQSWYLNGKALVLQARFQREEALALYLEGQSPDCPGMQADRFTCRTNAAILLISRRSEGDLEKAEQFLDSVVSKDSAAIRAPYNLRRIQLLRRASRGR